MTSEEIQRALRDLLDREAIRDLARCYADCVWRRDAAAAVELFAPDGVMDTGDRPPIAGREALLESYRSMIDGPDLQPFVHNHVIALQGDAATGRCYLDLRATMDGKSMIGSGHYEDEYARIDGTWKFRRRKLVMKFLVPIQQGWTG